MFNYLILLVFLLISPSNAFSQTLSGSYTDEIFDLVALEVGVPKKLLRAVCWTESRFRGDAFAAGDGKGSNHAFGICQVLYTTAMELGFNDVNCTKDFSDGTDKHGKALKASRAYKDCKLFGIYTNVFYAAKYLKSRLELYKNNWISAIAAYNAGTVQICKRGYVKRAKDNSILWRCTPGRILNENYVDLVLKAIVEER